MKPVEGRRVERSGLWWRGLVEEEEEGIGWESEGEGSVLGFLGAGGWSVDVEVVEDGARAGAGAGAAAGAGAGASSSENSSSSSMSSRSVWRSTSQRMVASGSEGARIGASLSTVVLSLVGVARRPRKFNAPREQYS